MKCIEITPPADIQTCIQLPSSKSICNRALIINALAGSTCRPENLSDCDDTRVMIEALTHMPETIDIMAAGTAMRFLTAYLSVTPGTHVLTGTERMRQRPIKILVDALRSPGRRLNTRKMKVIPVKDYGKGTGKTFTLSSGKCQFAIYLGLADDRTDAGTRLEP